MPIAIDPQERELRALDRIARWKQQRVLEIGCGDGRLSLRLASLGARVSALDPSPANLRKARASLTRQNARRITFRLGQAERLPYRAREFDVVVFAWSL